MFHGFASFNSCLSSLLLPLHQTDAVATFLCESKLIIRNVCIETRALNSGGMSLLSARV
jgi:hypothetical protein